MAMNTHNAKTSEEYESAYKRLNPEQKEAVDSIEGPIFVIAGPGTGKTQILTLRIANILQKTDTPPDGILALTFTEAAAAEMRERLARLIGSGAAQKVRIHTYHGFAESLIARFPDAFPRIIGGEIATDVERAEMLDAAILNTKLQYLKPFGDQLYYHYEITRAISTMKRENVTPEALRSKISEIELEYESIPDKVHMKGKYEGKLKGEFETLAKKIAKTRDLLAVYEAYEAELVKRKRYDFEDLILETVRALTEDESFRREVQEGLLYVLADEHQDANRAQNAMLELLVEYHDSPNLFIVGDEKQAIYRFQGADLDNVHYFRERFPGTKVIALVANYRSHQTILDTALSLIAASPDARLSRVPLVASGNATAPVTAASPRSISVSISMPPIRRVECETPESEMQFLSNEVDMLLKAGTPADEIAVLVRTNKDVGHVADALRAAGIPVSRGTEGAALENRFVAVIVRLLHAILTPKDEYLSTLLTLPGFKISAADAWRIIDLAKREKVPALDVLALPKLLETAHVSKEGIEHAGKLRAFLNDAGRLASVERPVEVAQSVLYASGILDAALLASDRDESLAAIRTLLRAFEELSQREHSALLPRALELLALHEARGIPLAAAPSTMPGLVRVMTVHKSKGREFEYVFIPRFTERAWSTRSRAEHFYLPDILSVDRTKADMSGELEDERRLLYVAITRAKRAAVLSYALTREDGKAEQPSSLIDDLDPKLVSLENVESTLDIETETEGSEKYFQKSRARSEKLLHPAHSEAPSKEDLDVLRRAFIAQGLSPTALNNFIECPWHYFYVNLLRIPQAENKHMLYGTAIHAALKAYADRRVRGDEMNADYVYGIFDRAISRSPISEKDLDELREKGKRALTAWWKKNQPSWPAKAESELPVFATIVLDASHVESGTNEVSDISGEFVFRGNIDRMDPLPGGTFSVVDYKTGKVKSRNALMGKTASSDGNYYRQLVSYKLLLEKGDPSRDMSQGIIEFVEPDEDGEIQSEVFQICAEEVIELEELIKKTAGEILTLSFWNTPCDAEDCEWCAIRFAL